MAEAVSRDGAVSALSRAPHKCLNLLDLPHDILKEIVKEVTHTNDLTSLALSHSALHSLAIPHIYSRFDIVWPDASAHVETRAGVDALTYGLATLVFGEELFSNVSAHHNDASNPACSHCEYCCSPNAPNSRSENSFNHGSRIRRGNYYAHYTRKFSLGNGPADWVQEYLISKEGGKMLGTLVAVAVARMRNLETFVWDMPTGVLRDVWIALASLGDRKETCKLEKVWIRWHDNSQLDAPSSLSTRPIPTSVGPLPLNLPNLGNPGAFNLSTSMHAQGSSGISAERIEQPTFSILPPLKSLTVLDIDEVSYLDEMRVLIGKSQPALRELRVGIARHALKRSWTSLRERGISRRQDTDAPSSAGKWDEKRYGGVLGTLLGGICPAELPVSGNQSERPLRPDSLPVQANGEKSHPNGQPSESADTPLLATNWKATEHNDDLRSHAEAFDVVYLSPSEKSPLERLRSNHERSFEVTLGNDHAGVTTSTVMNATVIPEPENMHFEYKDSFSSRAEPGCMLSTRVAGNEHHPHHLELQILELERVSLSVVILIEALDWSMLRELTILDCQYSEQLWKALRRAFPPIEQDNTTLQVSGNGKFTPGSNLKHRLTIRKLHTNAVSNALIALLTETLPSNSLEVLFLQDSKTNPSSVHPDAIFRGPVSRHRSSLKKLSIDSSEKSPDGHPIVNSRWRKWLLNRENLSFICSGRMLNLRELGMAIKYRDWHFFLQRLPSISQIRSLYIPFIADHAHGNNIDARELALQIVDIITLKPDIGLCYMGIATKCFEILEVNAKSSFIYEADTIDTNDVDEDYGGVGEIVGTEDEDLQHDFDGTPQNTSPEPDDTDDETVEAHYEHSEPGDDDRNDAMTSGLKLREILFYDDKVAVFKARHGKL